MDEEQIRQIIKEELSGLFGSDRYTFQRHLQIFDGRNVQTGRTVGTKIGTAADQLIGFYGTTRVNQPATVTDASVQGVGYVQADVQSIADAVNALIDRNQEIGIIA